MTHAAAYPYASLGHGLIRRAGANREAPTTQPWSSNSTFGQDLRFFAVNWAAGFLFFLAYLA
jgi:hypothetical protein